MFWLLSGNHSISSPVIISDAFTVTVRSYPGIDVHYKPIIVFNSSKFCNCTQVCQQCSVVQFNNSSGATVEWIQIVAVKSNVTSPINGISFTNSHTITVHNVSVSIGIGEGKVKEYCTQWERFKNIYSLCVEVFYWKSLVRYFSWI